MVTLVSIAVIANGPDSADQTLLARAVNATDDTSSNEPRITDNLRRVHTDTMNKDDEESPEGPSLSKM
jgi:hypothetical protein